MLNSLWSAVVVGRGRKRGRGGWRQQLAADPEPEEAAGPSRVGLRHLLKWCEGHESAYEVKVHMDDAMGDGLKHPMIQKLAGIGKGGKQHCHADLVSLLGTCGIPQLLTEVEDSYTSCVLLPSTLLGLMHKHYRGEFGRRLGAKVDMLRDFWSQFMSKPVNREWASHHPVLRGRSAADLECMVPCTIHQDAGPYSKKSSCDCWSFSSLLANGNETLTKYLMATSIKLSGQKPSDRAWSIILKDFDDLSTGLVKGAPVARDEDGTVWSFVLLFAKADQECQCVEWGLPHYGGQDEVCTECLANRTNRPFTDLSAGAKWRQTEKMPVEFYLQRPRQPLHPLLASHYFTRWFCYLDIMHLLDCKGVAAWTFGGLLHHLLRDDRLGPNREERLAVINSRRASWYTNRPGSHIMPKIFMASCKNNGWADLSGPAIKAAVTRGAAGFFQSLCHEFYAGDTAFDVAIRAVLDNLAAIYKLFYESPMFLSDAAVALLKRQCIDFGENYQRLRGWAKDTGQLAWPVRPKVHKMQHLPLFAAVINPVFVQCYAEESLVGTTVRVWRRSMSGRYKGVVQKTVLLKRVAGLMCNFEL